jgi:hypothetical protein
VAPALAPELTYGESGYFAMLFFRSYQLKNGREDSLLCRLLLKEVYAKSTGTMRSNSIPTPSEMTGLVEATLKP